MWKKLCSAIFLFMALAVLAGCAPAPVAEKGETFLFTDSAGREVELPRQITRVAPSGSVATMILATVAPDLLVSVSSTPSSNQYQYLPEVLFDLPTTGQLYGSKSTINMEALIAAAPQVVIDLGDPKEGMAADLDALQKQTGIPVIYVRADLPQMAEAYHTLGQLLDKEAEAEELASFISDTLAMAAANSAAIPEAERCSVLYGAGSSGLDSNAKGSIQSQVLELVGAENAVVVEDVSNKGGGNPIDMEQLYLFDPDVILVTEGGPFASMATGKAWQDLSAIKNDAYYEIPLLPYNWLSNPPSVNMVLGIWWLGNLIYPDVYNYDMTEKLQEMFRLFWDYDLSEQEAASMLANSIGKRDANMEADAA